MIPLLLNIRIKTEEDRIIGLWFPLFLIWLVIFPFLAAFFPFVLLAALITIKMGYSRLILFSYLGIFCVIWNSSGTIIDISSKEAGMIYLNFI